MLYVYLYYLFTSTYYFTDKRSIFILTNNLYYHYTSTIY